MTTVEKADYLERAKAFFENATEAHDNEDYPRMTRWLALSEAASRIAQVEQARRNADAQVAVWQYVTMRDGANGQRWANAAADALRALSKAQE